MARVSTYLDFARSTEEAFDFYRTVFGNVTSGNMVTINLERSDALD
jgi:predicted 3-demethylubiquinone-9 3-methyltransferase (glyoxalase superfamily)